VSGIVMAAPSPEQEPDDSAALRRTSQTAEYLSTEVARVSLAGQELDLANVSTHDLVNICREIDNVRRSEQDWREQCERAAADVKTMHILMHETHEILRGFSHGRIDGEKRAEDMMGLAEAAKSVMQRLILMENRALAAENKLANASKRVRRQTR
jgi:hypothetical protein